MTWFDSFFSSSTEDEETDAIATKDVVKTIIEKIDALASDLRGQIDDCEEQIETLREDMDSMDAADAELPDNIITEEDLESTEERLQEQIDELNETIDGFTEIYETISSQYNPLIGEDDDEQKREEANKAKEEHNAKPDKTEAEADEERSITVKDSLTDEEDEFTLGSEPSKDEEQRRKHIEETKQDQPREKKTGTTRTPDMAEKKPSTQDTKSADTSTSSVIEIGQSKSIDKNVSEPSENKSSDHQDEFISHLIAKKKQQGDVLGHSVSGDQRFFVDGHEPFSDILDVAQAIHEDKTVFKDHVMENANIQTWIRTCLDLPGLADDLAGVKDRDEYITSLLAAA